MQASQSFGILIIKLGPTDIISKMTFCFFNFDHQIGTYRYYFKNDFLFFGGAVLINMLSVWMFNIKFVLLFAEIPTKCCFYFCNDIVIESNLSKSYVKENAKLFSIYSLITR